MAAVMLQCQSSVVATETLWAIRLRIFIAWLLKDKLSDPCSIPFVVPKLSISINWEPVRNARS